MKTKYLFITIILVLSSLLFVIPVSAESNLTEAFNDLFMIVTILSVVVFFFVLILWGYFIAKYREGTDAKRKKLDHSFSRRLEIGWTLVAVLIIIGLMLASYPYLFNTIDNNEENVLFISGEDETQEIIVEGTGSWQWRFHLNGIVEEPVKSEDGISETTMTLQVDTPYTFVLWSSGNLIHSFFVREFNFKQDVTPGNNNTFSIIILKTGVYNVLCAEFCGPGHSEMRGNIIVEGA